MAIEAAVYVLLVLVLGAPAWIAHLALVPSRAFGPEPWQLVTSGLLHGDVRSLILDLIGLWFIGSAVEQQLGARRMVAAFVVGQVAGAAAATWLGEALAPEIVMAGCAFGVAGLLAGLAVACWSLPLSLFGAPPVRGRWVALLLVAVTVADLLWHSAWVQLAGTLGGMSAAALLLATLHRPRPLGGWFRSLRDDVERVRMWRLRRRYRVLSGGRDDTRLRSLAPPRQ